MRQKRLISALATSAFSKLLAVAVQLAALPLALSALGTNRYAALLSLQALVAWIVVCAMGIVPSLPSFMTAAVVSGNTGEQRALVKSTVSFMGSVCIALVVALLLTGLALPPTKMISAAKDIPGREIWNAFNVFVVISCLQLFTSIVPSIRAGFQELHRVNLVSASSNGAVLVMLLFFYRAHPSIWLFVVFVYGPLSLFMLLDLLLLFRQRPYLLHGPAKFRETTRMLLPHSFNAVLKQMTLFLVSYCSILVLAHLTGPRNVSSFASVMQPLALGASAIGLIFQPLVPAIANAYSHGDHDWLKRAYLGGFVIVLGVTLSVAVVLAIAGPELARLWLHADVGISHALCAALGAYFVVWMVSDYHFLILASMGKLIGYGKLFALEGVIGIVAGSLLTLKFGEIGMACGIGLGIGSVTAWYLPLEVWRMVRPQPRGDQPTEHS